MFSLFSGLTKHLLQILGLHVYMPDDCRFNSTRAGLAEMHVYRETFFTCRWPSVDSHTNSDKKGYRPKLQVSASVYK